MGKRVTSTLPVAKQLWQEASEVFGVDLLRACELGPKSTLDATKVCQPATVVTSLAALALLNHDNPKACTPLLFYFYFYSYIMCSTLLYSTLCVLFCSRSVCRPSSRAWRPRASVWASTPRSCSPAS